MSNSSCICLPRLVVRTSGFHPDNMGSIPVGDAKDLDNFKVFFFIIEHDLLSDLHRQSCFRNLCES